MIYTILLNPTIDQIFYVPDFYKGGTFKVEQYYRFPVGKSISVALTLQEIKIPVQVLALIGKDDIPEYEMFLQSRQISHEFIPVDGKTRSNTTIVDMKQKNSTHLRFPSFTINPAHLNSINLFLESHITEGDFVVFSGSMPSGCPINYYFTVSEIIHRKKAHFILDTSGEPLRDMLLYNPYFIKGNIEEIGTVLGTPLLPTPEFDISPTYNDLYTLMDKCDKLRRYNTLFTIVTLAQYGALAMNYDSAYHSILKIDSAPFTVGSGDAFLAGVLAGLSKNQNMESCLRLATACGAANTQTIGPGILKKSDVDAFLPRVKIKKLK